MKFCWNESGKDDWFGLDKLEHFCLHLLLAGILSYFYGILIAVIISEIVGAMIEAWEMTDHWDRWLKNNWLSKLFGWDGDGKSWCWSIKDLIVNHIGMIAGCLIGSAIP